MSLLRTGYLSSAANVLTSSLKIWHVTKRGLLEHNIAASDQWIWERCCDADFNNARARLPYCLSKHPLKGDLLDIYLTTFSESVTSKIQTIWGSSFFWKCLKFHLDFKDAAKNSGKVLFLWDNCILIGIVKFFLLRRGYFSLVANVLTSSPKIWHVNKRDFFEHIFLLNDQWIC